MDKKQQNVKQAKTLSEYANIAFPRDKTVCMFFLFYFLQFGDKCLTEKVWFIVRTHTHTFASTWISGEILAEMKWNKRQIWSINIPIKKMDQMNGNMWIIR